MSLDRLFHRVLFPAQEAPVWSEAIERWYQLDAYAYSLVETFHRLNLAKKRPPEAMILASPLASNEMDCQFAQTGADSPTKFVHTLPNVRSAPLCQMMKWLGPVLCIQKDPHTLECAMTEAMEWVRGGESPIWIWSVRSVDGLYEVEWCSVEGTGV